MSLALFHSRLGELLRNAQELAGVTVLDELSGDVVALAKAALLTPGAFVMIRGGDLAPLDGNHPACALFMARVPVTLCLNETKLQATWTLAALTDAIIRAVHGKLLYETSQYSSTIMAINAQCVPMDDDGIQTTVIIFEVGLEYLPNP